MGEGFGHLVSLIVMPGFMPGIHVFWISSFKGVDGGQASLRSLPKVGCKPGHDELTRMED
jgi:hypothetical protein